MATITAVEGKVPGTTTRAAAPAVKVDAPSRREFLFYIWGASIALLLGQSTAGLIWFSLPRFKAGTFGGVFDFQVAKFPVLAGAEPVSEPSGRFHVVRTADDGFLALYGVCTHLGCLPKWQVDRFACPCHGSQYELDGTWITGPAPRGLDRFATEITFTDGTVEATDPAGAPIKLNGRTPAKIAIDTGKRIKLPNHP